MRFSVITLRYSPTLGILDPTPLDDLARHHEILSLKEHFFCIEGVPHLACVVATQEPVVAPDGASARAESTDRSDNGRQRKDPTAGLDEAERRLFNTMRDWRSAKAHEEGVPRYLVFTNHEFIQLIKKRPTSRTALSQIEGIGPKKTEKYAEELLAMLRDDPRTTPLKEEGAKKPGDDNYRAKKRKPEEKS